MSYISGHGFPKSVLDDGLRAQRLFSNKWAFVACRADIARPRDYFQFKLFDEQYFLVHGSDGQIRCFVNRCAHQSARLLNQQSGRCAANIICPNHQWAFSINEGKLRHATGIPDLPHSQNASDYGLDQIPVFESHGLLFVCLGENPAEQDMLDINDILTPYLSPFEFGGSEYKTAYHHREIIDANWLHIMINNRECCHCAQNHKQLLKVFDPSSFNGESTPEYEALFQRSVKRWQQLGLHWKEDAFSTSAELRVARYPFADNCHSVSFDGQPICNKKLKPFKNIGQEPSTLSVWLNPNAWIHFTADHIATNWVLPLNDKRCELYTSWIVDHQAIEGIDYTESRLTEAWKVTNAEDVDLCLSMQGGSNSRFYRPGPFSDSEKFCTQFCDWYMANSN